MTVWTDSEELQVADAIRKNGRLTADFGRQNEGIVRIKHWRGKKVALRAIAQATKDIAERFQMFVEILVDQKVVSVEDATNAGAVGAVTRVHADRFLDIDSDEIIVRVRTGNLGATNDSLYLEIVIV